MGDRYFSITFPVDLVREPVLYSLAKRHDLEPVVYKASVTHSAGWLVLSLAGPTQNVDAAILELKCRGALVREGDRSVLDSEGPERTASMRVRVLIPQEKIAEPIYSRIIKNHDVVLNIRQARITGEQGTVEMEISGELEAVDAAIDAMKNDGMRVDPIERDVIE
ncbi:MAG: hypothetical protein OEZ04_08690 [Nitrospinota bacterium]|nr:hypothetical protein [Nitrospinota bacterium]